MTSQPQPIYHEPVNTTPLQLPLDDAWAEILSALKSHQNLVLVAEPGAGKTTRVPPLLLKSGLIPEDQKILMLEPRRLAARASALRISDEQGWALGNEVGYQVRFDNKTNAQTKIEILTEGLLARRLQSDPELKNVGAILLDEFHERSQHTDLSLGLLFELQELSRSDLRIIVMSATLDAERVSSYLNDCPIVRVPGRTYPVDIHYSPSKSYALDTGPQFLDHVSNVCKELMDGSRKRIGDVLVFLPGTREIRGVRERIHDTATRFKFEALELHGSLTLDEQTRAVKKVSGQSRIVLATNIAETSLTLDGVGTVVDTGLARITKQDAAGFTRLLLSRISRASSTQRAGRAGRQEPGLCYRLWSKFDESSIPEFETAELMRTDLAEPLMSLLSQGVNDPFHFSWFEKPEDFAIHQALNTLTDLGFRNEKDGSLTHEGREALKFPLPPRLARLMLESVKLDVPRLGAKLSALLSEKDIVLRGVDLKRQAGIESDVLLRLHLLGSGRGELDRHAVRNNEKVAELLESTAKRVDKKQLTPPLLKSSDADETAMQLLLLTYPDRLCRRRRAKEGASRMVGGKGVNLSSRSSVETSEYFVALDSAEPNLGAGNRFDVQITLASRVDRDWIEKAYPRAISKKTTTQFDFDTKSVQKLTASSFRDLPMEEPHLSRPNAEEAFPVLIQALSENFESLIGPEESIARIEARIKFLKEQSSFPEFDERAHRELFLEEVSFGETRLSDILAKDLAEAFVRHLPPEIRSLLSVDAPDALTVPSGSRIRIQYPEGRSPFLEVRIQEVFGLLESPRIAQGRVPIVMHLLGPNYRPVQVTSDLKSFWGSGYQEVRKELRSRYPKHSWPDDPLSARPEAKGRPRR